MQGFSQEDRLREEAAQRSESDQNSYKNDDRTASYLSDFREKESIEDILSEPDGDDLKKDSD
jgi:hypothetical protein